MEKVKDKQSDKGGRPTKYLEKYNPQVTKLCLLGATDVAIADFFDVAVSTIYEWRTKYPEFTEATKKGKAGADMDVVASLYKKAIGSRHTETKKEYDDGSSEPIAVTVTTKVVPPDTTAIIFWLKNRNPNSWRDKKEIEIDDKTPRTPEERKVRIAELRKKADVPD